MLMINDFAAFVYYHQTCNLGILRFWM